MRFRRRSGILLHVTSLPGPFGIGDLGDAAYQFVDFLCRTGQRIWQVLPLGPAAKGNSPYTSFSAFAGNPLLVSPAKLVEDGLLDESCLQAAPRFPDDEVAFDEVSQFKRQLLEKSFERFVTSASEQQRHAAEEFDEQNRWWLDDYALFMALTEAHNGVTWTEWDLDLVQRRPDAMDRWTKKLNDRIQFIKYVQYVVFEQWRRVKAHANDRGVDVLGDVPIFLAHESADVWEHQDLFHLDERGRPTEVAGVPPDYFSGAGQLWNNPLYRWDVMAATGYQWWVRRLKHALAMFDIVRLDHFRGFEAYWAVPAGAPTAVEGRWEKGPGVAPFHAAESQLGTLPIVAEDLGHITPEVHAIRDELGLPGMRVLQFAFGETGAHHRPHNYPRHCVAYTGTHDNDTAVGWFLSGASSGRAVHGDDGNRSDIEFAMKYLGTDGQEIHWDLIRSVMSSVADTAIVPLQDVLGLGSQARINTPGQSDGNWKWRLRHEMLNPETEARLLELTTTYGRGVTE